MRREEEVQIFRITFRLILTFQFTSSTTTTHDSDGNKKNGIWPLRHPRAVQVGLGMTSESITM